MSKRIRLAPLADHIVSRTPFRSYRNRQHLEGVILERNYRRLNYSGKAVEILTDMVEQRLTTRDGGHYSELHPTGGSNRG